MADNSDNLVDPIESLVLSAGARVQDLLKILALRFNWRPGTVDPVVLSLTMQLATSRLHLETVAQLQDLVGLARAALDPEAKLEHAAIAAHDRAMGPTMDEVHTLLEALQRRCDQLRDERDEARAALAELQRKASDEPAPDQTGT